MDDKIEALENVFNSCEELRDKWADVALWCENVGLNKEGAIMRQCISGLWLNVQEPIRDLITKHSIIENK